MDSTVYLTVVQADDFISKITAGIAKQPKKEAVVETVEEVAEELGGEVMELTEDDKAEIIEKESNT